MVFNGHTEHYIESLDEELFTEIQVMYADGLLGNRGIYDALTPLTTGVFNFLRGSGSAPIKQTDIFPWINEYSIDPETEPTKEEKVSSQLLAFMAMAPGFDAKRFQHGKQ